MRPAITFSLGALSMGGIVSLALLFPQRSPPVSAALAGGDLSIQTTIQLAPDGDRDGNGQIDAGDTITMTFLLANGRRTPVSAATLRTTIDPTLVHRFWNLRGATGFVEEKNVLAFPNLHIPARGSIEVQLDATVDYAVTEGVIALDPELRDGQHAALTTQSQGVAQRIMGGWKGRTIPSLMTRIRSNASSPAR